MLCPGPEALFPRTECLCHRRTYRCPKQGLPPLPISKTFHEAARNGFRFYQQLQLDDGHWGCGYGGPSFLLAGVVIAMYITDTPIPPEWKTEIIRYLSSAVNPDGGWGLHSAGHSTVFATTLYYINLRILGLEASHPLAAKARACLHALGMTFS